MKKRLLFSQKAQILILMVIILASLLLAISAMLGYVSNTVNFYKRQIDFSKGLYYAESGIQKAIYLIKEKNSELIGSAPWQDTITINGVDVDITINETAQENIYSVTSSCDIGPSDIEIDANIKRRIYSSVEIETIDNEERLIFKRYKSAKVLEIDY